jgi:Tfp pilus assembly ATPase PilU
MNILGVVQLVMGLVTAGYATEQQIAGQIEALRGKALTDEECNQLLEGILSDAERRKALAQQDVVDAAGQ